MWFQNLYFYKHRFFERLKNNKIPCYNHIQILCVSVWIISWITSGFSLKNGGSMFLRNVVYLHDHMAIQPIRPNRYHHCREKLNIKELQLISFAKDSISQLLHKWYTSRTGDCSRFDGCLQCIQLETDGKILSAIFPCQFRVASYFPFRFYIRLSSLTHPRAMLHNPGC